MKISNFCKFFFLFAPILSSCNTTNIIKNNYYFFNCLVNTTLYNSSLEIANEIENILSYYDNLFNAYSTSLTNENNIYDINNTEGKITVNDDIIDILDFACNVNNDLFNILSLNLNLLYKDSYLNNTLPSQNDIDTALNEIKNSSLIIDKENNQVEIIGEANIDLGALSKGYVLNKIYQFLNDNNANNYLIDLGSSSIALGVKPNNDSFKVVVKDIPKTSFLASNCFISTSSNYEQGIDIDGVRYSHIINPVNGDASNYFDLVIIKNDNALLGDMLTTLIMLQDNIEDVKNIIDQYDINDILIYKDEILVYQQGNWW